MKYLLKSLTTNNRDLKTALLFQISHTHEWSYLFSCPDGFQRTANYQKLKFNKVKVVFVPSLHPDHFAGFPGFFLSAREQNYGTGTEEAMKMVLVGPKATSQLLTKAESFMGEYWNDLQVVELPDDLTADLMQVDHQEESKSEASQVVDTIFKYNPEVKRIVYQDSLVTVYPMSASGDQGNVYSYFGVPVLGNGKFLPKEA